MNRATPPKPSPIHTNGHYETPLESSGVSLRRPAPVHKPTVFPSDLPLRGLSAILYGLHRFHLSGLAFSRYVAAFWLLIAALAALGALPGRWITMTIALLLWVVQVVISSRHSRQHYVKFIEEPLVTLNGSPLETNEKLPIYATGLLSVEGRYQTFSALPGFYRTFATGEHAILCLVQQRNWMALLSWPADEVGMWYAFIKPGEIQQIRWGVVRFGNNSMPGLAVQYELEIPPGPRRKRAEVRQETLYLATPQVEDAQRIYVDLLNNLPTERVVLPTTHTK